MNKEAKGISVVITCDWGFEGNQPVSVWINPRWLRRPYHTWRAHSCDDVLFLSTVQAYRLGLTPDELSEAMDKPLRRKRLKLF